MVICSTYYESLYSLGTHCMYVSEYCFPYELSKNHNILFLFSFFLFSFLFLLLLKYFCCKHINDYTFYLKITVAILIFNTNGGREDAFSYESYSSSDNECKFDLSEDNSSFEFDSRFGRDVKNQTIVRERRPSSRSMYCSALCLNGNST